MSMMPAHPIRTLAFIISLLICAAGFAASPPPAHASPQANLLAAKGVVSVDRTTFFDEGKYINMLDAESDLAISDFSASGGTMRVLEDSMSRYDPDFNWSPYEGMQIFVEGVYGRTEGIPGFGFVCDKTASAANGASVSVTYDYVGDMKDIADPSFNVPVSIRATYTVREGQTVEEEGNYADQYNGHPVIQIPKCFSHGVFFVGTNVLDARYELFDARTGNPIELGKIFVTATSLNRGEGFGLPSANVAACYVSNEAPAASSLYNFNGVKTPYDVIAGSLLYDKSAEFDNGYTTFVGCPDVYDKSGNDIDFADSIGHETFYWRSVCFAVDNKRSNAIDAKVYAIKTTEWSGTPGVPSDGSKYNGGLWFATNFMALTSVKPPAPTKTVDKASDVHLGDTLTYRVSQQVNDLGATSFIRYDSFSLIDQLPSTLAFKSARLVDGNNNPCDSAGTVRFDENTRTVSFEFSKDFCESGMLMQGETYTLEIMAEVIDYPDDGTLAFANSARAVINGTEQPTDEIITQLASPRLSVEKHVAADPSTTSIYEFAVGDEITFNASLRSTVERTRAKGVSVADTLPEGLALVPGSVAIAGTGKATVSETENGWLASLDTFDFGETLDITYRATATETGNGTEAVNTAAAWAANIQSGTPGSKSTPVCDDSEVFINSPRLSLSEEASVSPLTESAYEHRVDEPLTFTVTVENTAGGTIANALETASLQLPEGLAIVDKPDAVRVGGIPLEGDTASLDYPVRGDDGVHGETESRTIEAAIGVAEDRLSASLSLTHLPAKAPVTLSFECMPTEEVNGLEVFNQATAYAENATDPVTNDPATKVWINSPRLVVSKQAPSLAYQTGDLVTYRIDASNHARGTVARNVVFEDVFETPGMELMRNSIVVSDQDGTIVTDKVDIVQNIGTQDWAIETQSALVNGENRRIWNCSPQAALIEVAEPNPLNIEREQSYRIEYQALITDKALASQTATNSVTVTSDENLPAADKETISVDGPALGITKTADIGLYRVGDTAEYAIEVTGLRTGETAHNVRIGDGLSADNARAAVILDGSVSLRNEQGRPVDGWDIEWIDNEAGEHTGFTIGTHADLPDTSKLIVSYRVKFTAKTASKAVANTSWAEADDAPRVTATCTVTCADPDDTSLVIEKSSDSPTYPAGFTARYALGVSNLDESEPARSIVVSDALASTDAASIAQGSVVVRNGTGAAVESAQVVYHADENGVLQGYTVETDYDLAASDALTVSYETLMADDAQPGSVVKNAATASADNTGDASTDHEVEIGEPSETNDLVLGYTTTAYKSANPVSGSAVEAGSEIAYLITVKNTGAETASTARVRDYIPEGTTYIFDSVSEGGAFVRASAEHAAYVEWVLTDLEPRDERTVGFTVRVDDDASGWIVNTARYDTSSDPASAGDPTLPDPERMTARVVHSVNVDEPVGPVVNVVKSSSPEAGQTVREGEEIAYVLTVSNQGDKAAADVAVRDSMPEGTSYVHESATEGGVFDAERKALEWLIPRIEPGSAIEMSFKVVVAESYSVSTVTNQASFAWDAADRIGSVEELENTSNIVEHPLPAKEARGGAAPAPRTGDGLPVLVIGILAATAIGAIALAAIARSKKRQSGITVHEVSPGIAASRKPEARRPARRRKDYLRWR